MAKEKKQKNNKVNEEKEKKKIAKIEKKKLKKDKKKIKKEKKRYVFGPIEFSFNFISLVVAICIGLYFGGRSFYYYSLQSQTKKEIGMTLNGALIDNNKLVKENADGFHKDDNGYFFMGNVTNNYVWFANREFRVMRINEDGSVKLVSENLLASFMWGMSADYASSNVHTWLTKTDKELSGFYYNTFPNQGRFISKTKYTIDVLTDTKVEMGDVEFEDYILPITLNDYVTAGGKSSYLNNGKLFYILGYNEDGDNLYIEEDGSIMNCDFFDGYGLRGVFTMNKNTPITQGDGSKDNPYVIDQGSDVNHVDAYVKLGDDLWKVYEEKDDKLKMYLNGYITVNGNEVVRNFSSWSSKLDYTDGDNIGSYLIGEYLNSLSYKDKIVDNVYPLGETSDEFGYTIANAYSAAYTGKVGLLNIFDYVSNNDLEDFFRGNVGSYMSTLQYATLKSGLLEEADVTDVKHIVPVVSIETKSITSGNGRIDNPYIVG